MRTATRIAVVLAFLMPVGPAQAQDRDPTPEELWEAYPLEPGATPAVPTPGSDIPEPAPTASPAPAPDESPRWYVPVAALTALGLLGGVPFVLRRRRTAAAPAEVPAAPPVERLTIEWRPSAPPPPPPAPPAPVKGGKR